jgi:predicted CoA-binding protein
MNIDQAIQQFLSSQAFGVAGASSNRDKYGNKVLRVYLQNHKKVYPINPKEKMIEGIACISTVNDLPGDVESLSIITPPPITEKIVEQAIAKGIKNIWMQPGAESPAAIANCQKNNINVIADGSCILVKLHFHES